MNLVFSLSLVTLVAHRPSISPGRVYTPWLVAQFCRFLQLVQLREECRRAADRLEESEAVQKVHAGRVIDLKNEVRIVALLWWFGRRVLMRDICCCVHGRSVQTRRLPRRHDDAYETMLCFIRWFAWPAVSCSLFNPSSISLSSPVVVSTHPRNDLIHTGGAPGRLCNVRGGAPNPCVRRRIGSPRHRRDRTYTAGGHGSQRRSGGGDTGDERRDRRLHG